MNRSLFMLLSGIYGLLLFIAMVFATIPTLQNYGVPNVDLSHISIMQFLGVSTGALALLLVLNRNAPNAYTLQTLLLAQGVYILTGVLLGVYHVYALNVPNSTFFVVDSLFRLALGLGFLYYYHQATQQTAVQV
jgi:flagellin-like protein